jgi:multicomponent Na+:H+ antiporter subunit E
VATKTKNSVKFLSILVYFLVLFALWYVLSGYLKPLLLFFGLVSVLFVSWMSLRAKALDNDALPLKLLLRLPFYWLWLVKEIFKSGITTTKIIWNNKPSPELIKIKASQKNSTGIANYANAITLTPGTVTIEVEKNDLLIHALSKELSEDLQTGEMDRFIAGLDK